MATKEGVVLQQIDLSNLNLHQLTQLKQQLDQVLFNRCTVIYLHCTL